MLIHKCGETCNEGEIRLLEGEEVVRRWKRILDGWWGKKWGPKIAGLEKDFRPLWHSFFFFSEAGSNGKCTIPVFPIHLQCCLFIRFIIYLEDFCHNLGTLLLSLFHMDTKAKMFSAADFYCLSFHFFVLNCPFYCSSRLFVLKSWAFWSYVLS